MAQHPAPSAPLEDKLPCPEPPESRDFWHTRILVIDHLESKAFAIESVLYGIAQELRKYDDRSRYLIRKILLEVQALIISGAPTREQYHRCSEYTSTSQLTDLVLFPEYTNIGEWKPSLTRWGFPFIYEATDAIFWNFPATIDNTFEAIAEIRALVARIKAYQEWEIKACLAKSKDLCDRPPKIPEVCDALICEFLSAKPKRDEVIHRAEIFSKYLEHYLHVFDVDETLRRSVHPDDFWSFFDCVKEGVKHPEPSVWNHPSDFTPYYNERLPAEVLANLDLTKNSYEFSRIYRNCEKDDWVKNPYYNEDAAWIDEILYRQQVDSDQSLSVEDEINENLAIMRGLYYHSTYLHRRRAPLPMACLHEPQASWKEFVNLLLDVMTNPQVLLDGQTETFSTEIKHFNRDILTPAEVVSLKAMPVPEFVEEYVKLTPFWTVFWNAIGEIPYNYYRGP